MTKLFTIFLLFLTFNVVASECEDHFQNDNYENLFDICYDEATHNTMTDQGEITSISDGTMESQYILGVLFEQGYDVEKNDWAAIYWYTKAADRGYPMAQYALGHLYYTSNSPFNIPMDIALTQYYLGLACKNGVTEACPQYENLLQL